MDALPAWLTQALVVIAAGGVGCGMRSLVRDGLVAAGVQAWGAVALINLLGAAAMGAVAASLPAGSMWATATGGVLAGWTTYSAFSVDVHLLWRGARRAAAALCWVVTVLGSPAIAWAAAWSCGRWGTSVTVGLAAVALAGAAAAVRGVVARRSGALADPARAAETRDRSARHQFPETRDRSAWHQFLLSAVAGGVLGSAARVAAALATAAAGAPEWSSRLAVNLLGAYGAGVLVARMHLREERDPRIGQPKHSRVLEHMWMTGVLGGFTTVSGFALDTAHAGSARAWGALGIILATNGVLGLAAAWLGLRWGRPAAHPVSQ